VHAINTTKETEQKSDQWSIQNKQNKTAVLIKSDIKPDVPPIVPKFNPVL